MMYTKGEKIKESMLSELFSADFEPNNPDQTTKKGIITEITENAIIVKWEDGKIEELTSENIQKDEETEFDLIVKKIRSNK